MIDAPIPDTDPDVQTSPIPARLEFNVDANASPLTGPNAREMVKLLLRIPPPVDERECESWIPAPRAAGRRPRRPDARKPIILRPFASFEAAEFCVKALTAVINGKPIPMTWCEQFEELAPHVHV
jgi:hypothetical protein